MATVKEAFACYESYMPSEGAETRRVSFALRRNGIDTMEQLCGMRRGNPEALKTLRDIGPKRLMLIDKICQLYETGQLDQLLPEFPGGI